jgi:hypothetical protein
MQHLQEQLAAGTCLKSAGQMSSARGDSHGVAGQLTEGSRHALQAYKVGRLIGSSPVWVGEDDLLSESTEVRVAEAHHLLPAQKMQRAGPCHA